MPKTCVFCSAAENINTSLTIKLDDGTKVAVDICDTHAEEATVKSAKDAYHDRQKKIEEVLAQMKALGMNVQTTAAGLVVAAAPEAPKPAKTAAPPADLVDDPDVVPTSRVDKVRGIHSVGGNTEMGMVTAHASHNLNSMVGQGDKQIPADALTGHAKMAIVEGREGQPLAIPTKRVDKLGTTRLNVINTGGDQALQRRFKQMAKDSVNDKGPIFGRDGYGTQYGTRTCPLCHGECEIMHRGSKIVCPKCNGVGEIAVG